MEFLHAVCGPEELRFFGVGDYAPAYIGESFPCIKQEEDIDACAQASCVLLTADGESAFDLALLDRVLERCKAKEVFVILVHSAPPAWIADAKQKCSCLLTLDAQDGDTGAAQLMELIALMHVCPALLQFDPAELRALFDPLRTVMHHSLVFDGDDPQALARELDRLEMSRHAWPTMICALLPQEDAPPDPMARIAPLLALLPAGAHHPLLWNAYRSALVPSGGMRVEIVRAKPAPGPMQALRNEGRRPV